MSVEVIIKPHGVTATIIGVPGPEGPVGPQGDQGPQGIQGEQGPPAQLDNLRQDDPLMAFYGRRLGSALDEIDELLVGGPETTLSASAAAVLSASDIADVFIYDTRKDSDGGRWRHRTSDRSWYTETLNTSIRGGRRKFPARALLVLQSTAGISCRLTIYDIDGGSAEMWMVADDGGANTTANILNRNGNGANAVSALNGNIYIAARSDHNHSGGLRVFDLIADAGYCYGIGMTGEGTYNGSIAERNSEKGFTSNLQSIASRNVNDVAANVLDGTPPNPDRLNLPNNTVAVATAVGVSAIHPDDSVADITDDNEISWDIRFTHDNRLTFTYDTGNRRAVRVHPLPFSDVTLSAFAVPTTTSEIYTLATGPFGNGSLPDLNGTQDIAALGAAGSAIVIGNPEGMWLIEREPAAPSEGMVAHITDTYNTGWMPGDVKLALAESSADVTALVGGTATDRSPAGNNATVNGTINRSVVAAGAELAAYSGFSASNYLEVPYSSDFDFDTDDWTFMCWFKTSDSSTTKTLLMNGYYNSGWSGSQMLLLIVGGSGFVRGSMTDNGYGSQDVISGNTSTDDGSWHFAVLLRRGNTYELYIDGESDVAPKTITGASNGSLTNINATLQVGHREDNTEWMNGDIALPRVIKGYALTAEQIAKMYADEPPLFSANAGCLLTSPNVKSLAYDEDKDDLYVGTADGTNVFDGLERVAYHDLATSGITNDDHLAVTAVDGAFAIASGAEAYASAPAQTTPTVPAVNDNAATLAAEGVTTDATPTDIFKLLIQEGTNRDFSFSVAAAEHNNTSGEAFDGTVTGNVSRAVGGNVTISNLVVTVGSETTASMDVTVEADTSAQTMDIKVTGVDGKTIVWTPAGNFDATNKIGFKEAA